MSTYGYVRQGYGKGTIAQLEQLLIRECDKLFIEGEATDQESELALLVETLQPKDHVIVSELSVFGKNLSDLTKLLGKFQEKDIRLTALDDELEVANGSDFYANLLLFRELDRQYKKRQVIDAYEIAKSRGIQWGRPRIQAETVQKIQFLYNSEKLPLRTIAQKCGVSLGTVHKYVSNSRLVK